MNTFTTITIDWPAGSGKGTTAKLLAKKLGFNYLDSGSMYRALGLYISTRCKDILNITQEELGWIEISFNDKNHVCVNGEDYEGKIRTSEIGNFASILSKQPIVRDFLIPQGQEIIKTGNYVLEGRDTGTIWAPDAAVKIFLIADAKVRAHRRWIELQAKNDFTPEDEILSTILERDERDMTRKDGPLIKPEGAHEIDTTHISIEEQVERIYTIVQEVLQK